MAINGVLYRGQRSAVQKVHRRTQPHDDLRRMLVGRGHQHDLVGSQRQPRHGGEWCLDIQRKEHRQSDQLAGFPETWALQSQTTVNYHDVSLGSKHPGGCHVLMCDGSASFVSESIELATLKAMASRASDEVFDRAP